ncbi:phenylalanine--tRNA ligase subunit alpha [Candidatus Micrarchaeota archaeon]|nr:phenylalanine--tRNA ligase subunit alpha [Candidatus Micrarchaeota archaeon]
MYKGEREILDILSKKGKMSYEDIAEKTGLHIDTVRRAAESLRENGCIIVSSEEISVASPTAELDGYARNGFPEFSVYEKARAGKSVGDLLPGEKSIGLKWAKERGLVGIEGGRLSARKSVEDAEAEKKKLLEEYRVLKASGVPKDKTVAEHFFQRRLLQAKTVKKYIAEPTGKRLAAKGDGFDLSVNSEDAQLGKNHPITKLSKRIGTIMAELGFEEMEGSIVESAFWNFDALFQPQDHPARELADTFYLEGKSELPGDRKLVERVKKAHEEGWKYKWSEEEARKTVLRTHTTALSARYLAAMKDKKPRKYFAIGRVFRNEATDYKHLAEFSQVEGIIAWEGATFRDLLGILKEVYRKLGFEKIRFRPSYFPYTEPSLEIEVYFEEKKQWMELGGAGIFRPEVSMPLAGVYPVLAWGLSLERPLMLMLDMKDIREFYRNDLNFLKSAKLKF